MILRWVKKNEDAYAENSYVLLNKQGPNYLETEF